ncbi:hypothetical protein ACFWXO_18660 [Kitasatospora sp. NPDC059088]|uniref:hypothetical protein n=1 Tax=Kitasatospora sp. NPDC059088 TaxID=3346722 RepID=UPI0036758E47
MKRRSQHSDPTAERARVGSLIEALEGAHADALVIVFGLYLFGLSARQVAQHFEIPLNRVSELSRTGLSGLSTAALSSLRSEFLDGSVPRDAQLPRVLRLLGFDEIDAWTCRHCRLPNLPVRAANPQNRLKGGRPRLYCSNACRQAAYRSRNGSTPRGAVPVLNGPPTENFWRYPQLLPSAGTEKDRS